MKDEDRVRVRVLGIGNLLWADDGFGVRVLEFLAASGRVPASIPLVDGGTQGIGLLPLVRSTQKLLLFDAVDAGLAPGTLRLFHGDEIPSVLSLGKTSLHQSTFSEVLALAKLFDEGPEEIVLIGVQPVNFDHFGGPLSPEVSAQIPEAAERGLMVLDEWGALKAELE